MMIPIIEIKIRFISIAFNVVFECNITKKIEITYFFDRKMFFGAAQKGSILLSAIRIFDNGAAKVVTIRRKTP